MPDWAVMIRLHKLLRKVGLDEPGAYSKHSAKTTPLSWAEQRSVSEEVRLKMGHHRPKSTSAKVQGAPCFFLSVSALPLCLRITHVMTCLEPWKGNGCCWKL